jgi:hypothetical protein
LKVAKFQDTVGKHALHGDRTFSASGTQFLTNAFVSHVGERGAFSGLCGTKSTHSKSHNAPKKYNGTKSDTLELAGPHRKLPLVHAPAGKGAVPELLFHFHVSFHLAWNHLLHAYISQLMTLEVHHQSIFLFKPRIKQQTDPAMISARKE